MEFLLIVTLLVLALGIGSAILPFVAFRRKLTRPFARRVGRAAVQLDRPIDMDDRSAQMRRRS